MIHFLRNKKGENIVETEVFGDIDIGTFELNSSILPLPAIVIPFPLIVTFLLNL